jgi:hypothetical protein
MPNLPLNKPLIQIGNFIKGIFPDFRIKIRGMLNGRKYPFRIAGT